MLLICWLGERGGSSWLEGARSDGMASVAVLRGTGAGGLDSIGIDNTAMAEEDMSGGNDAAREAMARGDIRCCRC